VTLDLIAVSEFLRRRPFHLARWAREPKERAGLLAGRRNDMAEMAA